MDLIDTIGDYAGLASFIGLAVLALLFFAQARDVRRLREWAGAAPERDAELVEATSGLAEQRSEELRRIQEEQRRREELLESERAAHAERERRRERRERGLPEQTRWERFRERLAGDPTGEGFGRRVAAVIIAIVVIAAGVAAIALGFFEGDDDNGASSVVDPGSVEVAVLNSTDVEGLANSFGDRVESRGYTLGTVTNSPSDFDRSVVMYERGFKPEADMVAGFLRIAAVRPIGAPIARTASRPDVAVILGADKTAAG